MQTNELFEEARLSDTQFPLPRATQLSNSQDITKTFLITIDNIYSNGITITKIAIVNPIRIQ